MARIKYPVPGIPPSAYNQRVPKKLMQSYPLSSIELSKVSHHTIEHGRAIDGSMRQFPLKLSHL